MAEVSDGAEDEEEEDADENLLAEAVRCTVCLVVSSFLVAHHGRVLHVEHRLEHRYLIRG